MWGNEVLIVAGEGCECARVEFKDVRLPAPTGTAWMDCGKERQLDCCTYQNFPFGTPVSPMFDM